MKPEQRIVCAALMYRDHRDLVVCGPRHFDNTMKKIIWEFGFTMDSSVVAIQGFVDQFGTFLTREEAWIIANKQGQIIRRVGGDEGKLFSENLY